MSSLIGPRDQQDKVKVPRPWAVSAIGVITFGTDVVMWYCRVTREMRDFGGANGRP